VNRLGGADANQLMISHDLPAISHELAVACC